MRRGRGEACQTVESQRFSLSIRNGARALVCFGAARFLPVLSSSPGDVLRRSELSLEEKPEKLSTWVSLSEFKNQLRHSYRYLCPQKTRSCPKSNSSLSFY